MVTAYAKSEKEDLSHAEKECIRKSVENFKRSQETQAFQTRATYH